MTSKRYDCRVPFNILMQSHSNAAELKDRCNQYSIATWSIEIDAVLDQAALNAIIQVGLKSGLTPRETFMRCHEKVTLDMLERFKAINTNSLGLTLADESFEPFFIVKANTHVSHITQALAFYFTESYGRLYLGFGTKINAISDDNSSSGYYSVELLSNQ